MPAEAKLLQAVTGVVPKGIIVCGVVIPLSPGFPAYSQSKENSNDYLYLSKEPMGWVTYSALAGSITSANGLPFVCF